MHFIHFLLEKFFPCAGGVVVSVILPVLSNAVRQAFPQPKSVRVMLKDCWETAKPYVLLGVFSLLTSMLVIAAVGNTIKGASAALIAGYLWDSTLQKLVKGTG